MKKPLVDDTIAISGTNIDAVKRQNERSGLSYNEAKQLIAQTTGGHGTAIYSDTDVHAVKEQNRKSQNNRMI